MNEVREYKGIAGRAWLYEPAKQTRSQEASLRAWILDCPGQSPAWHQYLLGLVHLRPIEGVAPATITVVGATHEFLLAALNPKWPIRTSAHLARFLYPLNVAHQEPSLTDEQAIRITDLSALAVVDGVLPAEPPMPEMGRRMWARAISQTAAHLRQGVHVPPLAGEH